MEITPSFVATTITALSLFAACVAGYARLGSKADVTDKRVEKLEQVQEKHAADTKLHPNVELWDERFSQMASDIKDLKATAFKQWGIKD